MRKMRSLAETLEALNRRPLAEFAGTGSPAGAAMDYRPDTSGVRMRGAQKNFIPLDDKGPDWPYDGTAGGGPASATGRTGQTGVGRGGVGWGGREDVSGGTREPSGAYDRTWQQEEGADWEESQRHGLDKYRNVWKDTPDGKEWTRLNKEGMGSPGRIGPFAPMDGPVNGSGRDARPVKDEDGDDVSPQYIETPYRDMSGPGNMWGGPGTIPGTTQGWANMPPRPEDEEDPEKNPMKLREFFDPSPVPVEEIDNPEQDHLKDQSDEDLEGRIDAVEPDDADDFDPSIEDPESFQGRLGGTSISIVPNLGKGSEFIASPDKMGAARGTYGLHSDGARPDDLVDKRSAWDVIELLVQNIKNSGEDF